VVGNAVEIWLILHDFCDIYQFPNRLKNLCNFFVKYIFFIFEIEQSPQDVFAIHTECYKQMAS
jgi:hypothetical protein